MKTRCIWCDDHNSNDDPDPDTLCIDHLSEYEGLSVSELRRRDDEQDAEYGEWVLGH